MTGADVLAGPEARHRAVIALGANLGDPAAALRGAVAAWADTPGTRVLACSAAYRTDPVGGPEQPDYLNAVLLLDTALDPNALLARAHEIEQDWGRVRAERWGPRTLDVDLIDVDRQVMASEALTLPHPRAHERAFVLVPWLQVDPDAELPGLGRVADLVAALDCGGVQATGVSLMSAAPRSAS